MAPGWSSVPPAGTARAWDAAPAAATRDDPMADALPPGPSASRRLLLALIAWPPVGLAMALLFGEVTGCGRYSAGCPDPLPLAGLLIQPGIVGVFLLLPRITNPAAIASFATGLAALGGGTALSATGGARAPGVASGLLLLILAAAYVAGLAGAVSGRVTLPAWLSPRS
jgi:hypothetical protein